METCICKETQNWPTKIFSTLSSLFRKKSADLSCLTKDQSLFRVIDIKAESDIAYIEEGLSTKHAFIVNIDVENTAKKNYFINRLLSVSNKYQNQLEKVGKQSFLITPKTAKVETQKSGSLDFYQYGVTPEERKVLGI